MSKCQRTIRRHRTIDIDRIARRCPERQRGTILILTMFIVLALAALVLVFASNVRVEARASANTAAQREAHFIALGAIEYIGAKALETPGVVPTNEDVDTEAVPLGDGWFWILKPDTEAAEGMTFGVADEASRLNINLVTAEMLLALPEMTDELAESVIDWRDADTEPQPAGAENGYYLSLEQPYFAKDGPYETLEELTLVRGGDPELLFGEDVNKNYYLDENEDDGDLTEPFDNGDGVLDRGMVDFLTVYSKDAGTNPDGEAKINVNDANPEGLAELLEEKLGVGDGEELANRIAVGRPYRNMVDFAYRSGLELDQFDDVHQYLTAQANGGGPGGGGGGEGGGDQQAFGKLNINTAPEEVIEALPGLTGAEIDSIIATRAGLDLSEGQLGWVTEAVPQEKAVLLGDFITTSSFQLRLDVLAVSRYGRSFKRYEVVIDVSSGTMQILHFADLTALGWPLDPQLLEDIRNGEFVGPSDRSIGQGAT